MSDMKTSTGALRKWISEAEDALERGVPPLDESGNQMSVESTQRLIEMWREELAALAPQTD